ncbi:MAG: SDR family NAD(P)-dependent oxidoreductase [Candidatus Binatia bacterium]
MSEIRKAVVVGVGPESGLGGALCRRFGREGLHVYVAGRTREKIDAIAAAIVAGGGQATPVLTDTTREEEVIRLFEIAERGEEGVVDLVVYNAGNAHMGDFRQVEASTFESVWRVGCFGGFLVGREAARRMLPRERGTVLFTGASASLRGRTGFAAFAAAKAGLRMIAQSMAREYGPQGIHVAHVVIDGGIAGDKIIKGIPRFAQAVGPDGLIGLEGLAEAYWQLYLQAKTAWTHELDLRTYKESF